MRLHIDRIAPRMLLVALGAAACADTGPPGRVELTLAPAESPDPFAGVAQLRLWLLGPALSQPLDPIRFSRGERVSFPAVPPGTDYVVRFEGLGAGGNVVSAGATPPLELRAGVEVRRKVFFGAVERFSVLAGASEPRFGHTLTVLPDGRALVLGGAMGDALATPVALNEGVALYDPAQAAVERTGGTFGRFDHTATWLDRGQVLVAGGRGADRTALPSMDTWVPGQQEPVPLGVELPEPRAGHTATRLDDGRVLFAGGVDASGRPIATLRVFDPETMRFEPASYELVTARSGHTATRLSDGRVLIAGGRGATAVLDSAEIFDPRSGVRPAGSAMRSRRALHTATVVRDRRVLLAGGTDGANVLRTFEAYDERLQAFVRVTDVAGADLQMIVGRAGHVAIPMSERRVLIGGGGDPGQTPPAATDSAVLWVLRDSATTADVVEAELVNLTLGSARYGAKAVALADGNAILVGGGAPQATALRAVEPVEVFVPRPD